MGQRVGKLSTVRIRSRTQTPAGLSRDVPANGPPGQVPLVNAAPERPGIRAG